MSAHEATAPEPSPEDPEGDEGKAGAAGGAGGLLRQHGRTLIVVVVVAIAAYAAFAGPGSGGDGGGDEAGSGPSTAATAAADGATSASGAGEATVTTAPGATEVTDPAPTSTLVPPDVENDRPAVDLATPPPADDPVEVARWWAATYTAHVGAEPPVDLVARLADWTAPALLDELRALPPAASYDPPLGIDGVSAIDLPSGTGAGGATGGRRLRVSVQTPVALVVYDTTLVQGGGGRWLVSEAARL